MSLSLSGWLPDDEHDGLSRRGPALVAAYDPRRGASPDDPALDVVVVGVVHMVAVKYSTSAEKPPRPEVRFTAIEAVEGPEADQVRMMLARLAEARAGVDSLPLEGLPDPDNVAEPRRPLPPDDADWTPPDDDGEGEPS